VFVDDDPTLSVAEAARLLGRDRTRVYALLRSGDMVAAEADDDGASGPLRIDRSSLERWLYACWLDVGEDDVWHSSVAQLRSALQRLGVRHVWRVSAGEHDGDYWSSHAPDYLRFYARAVRPEVGAGATAQL
jgi:enterochelin esterase-like enzyme